MADITPPSLATLPPALLRLIFPLPDAILSEGIKDNNPANQEWLAVKQQRPEAPGSAALLRALSQTCKSLRAFALPLLWSVVHVNEVEELGRLLETLRASPSIARHVRSFVFLWDVGLDLAWYKSWAKTTNATVLELVFSDRFAIWDNLRQSLGCEAQAHSDDDELYFTHDGKTHYAPGYLLPNINRAARYGYDFNHDEPRLGCSGPDGMGEDRLIKTPEQLQDALVELVRSFTSLETFGWRTFIRMPQGVFDALASLSTLTSLHIDLHSYGGVAHALPFWDLTANLERLSVGVSDIDDNGTDEQENYWASFELPAELPASGNGRRALHWRIAGRTVVAAARNGKLKGLKVGMDHHPVFALRSLVPCWVGLERPDYSTSSWQAAAMTLRPLLAHCSLWMDVPVGWPARQNRRLTRADVQQLWIYSTTGAMPEYIRGLSALTLGRRKDYQPVKYYLSWLTQDAQLAQQVTDAWNSVVSSGRGRRADVVVCPCDRCRQYAAAAT